MLRVLSVFTLLASAGLLLVGELLFTRAPAGGREEFYAKSAQELRQSSRDEDTASLGYHKKVIGIDKSDEPKDNFEWLAWHHDAEDKTESYAKLAALDRAKAAELDALVQNLALTRAEHLKATRVGSSVTFGIGIAGVSFLAFRRLVSKPAKKITEVTDQVTM